MRLQWLGGSSWVSFHRWEQRNECFSWNNMEAPLLHKQVSSSCLKPSLHQTMAMSTQRSSASLARLQDLKHPGLRSLSLLCCLPLPQHPSSAGTYVPFLNPWLLKNPPRSTSVDSFKYLRVMGQVNGIEGGWIIVFSTQISTCCFMFSWLLGSRK